LSVTCSVLCDTVRYNKHEKLNLFTVYKNVSIFKFKFSKLQIFILEKLKFKMQIVDENYCFMLLETFSFLNLFFFGLSKALASLFKSSLKF